MKGLRPGGLALLLTTTWDLPLNVGKGVITEFILAPGEVTRGLDGRWLTNLRDIPLWYITGDIWQSNTSGDIWYGFALVDAGSLLPINGETFDASELYDCGRLGVVRALPPPSPRVLPVPKKRPRGGQKRSLP